MLGVWGVFLCKDWGELVEDVTMKWSDEVELSFEEVMERYEIEVRRLGGLLFVFCF